MTRQSISNWENGKSYPDIEMIVKISEVLGTDPNSLIYPSNTKKKAAYRYVSYKGVMISLLAFWILLTFGGALIGIPMFRCILGGGISEEFLYPIYFGIMLLAGLVVGCTCYILEEIRNVHFHEDTKDKEDHLF